MFSGEYEASYYVMDFYLVDKHIKVNHYKEPSFVCVI
jgi:hypothetical protein